MSSVNLKRQKQINSQMNEVMDEFDRFEYFFATKWKKIVIVAVLAIVAVAVYCTVDYVQKNNQRKAAIAFSKAATIEEINTAVAQYPDAPAWLYLKLASLQIAQKDYAQAADALKKAAANPELPELQWRAQLNLAYLEELQNNYAAAAELFAAQAQSLRAPGSVGYACEAYCAAVRNYAAAKNNAKAAEVLTEADNYLAALPPQERMIAENFAAILKSMRAMVK